MPPQPRQIDACKEAQIQLALLALQQDPNLSVRRAAALYNAPRTTLRDRLTGRPSRVDTMANSQNLTAAEEQVVVAYILELVTRGEHPRLAAVADMANSLRKERGLAPVGSRWASTFVSRQEELKTVFNRKYDYKRALCEDPEVIQGWFTLVSNVKAKYGILDNDTYNFDETGFMMGQISSGVVVTDAGKPGRAKQIQPGNREWVTVIEGINATGWAIPAYIIFKARQHLSNWYKDETLPQDWVISISENGWTTNELGFDWLKHFDRHTKTRTVGTYRMLIIDGHESHNSAEFQQYCKDQKIVTLCMPAHSSHLLQPLDVGCFGPLKKAYGDEVNELMRNRINHITKQEFLPCFKAAHKKAINPSNIQGGFRGAGLVPFDPERVISTLDVKLRTPSPPLPTNNEPWQSQTPSNTLEFESQSTLIRNKYKREQGSSPTSVLSAIEHYAKGGAILSHKLALAQKRIRELEAAAEATARRKPHRRKRIQVEGSLAVEEGQRLTALKEFGARGDGRRGKKRVRAEGGEPSQRRCRRCGEGGHNARTCKNDVEEVSK
jgi:hypothetical protein